MMAGGIIVQQLAKPQVHIGAGRVTFLTQATRIATSPPSATGSDLVLTREGDALVAATAVSDEK
jgi:hypothetical protein